MQTPLWLLPGNRLQSTFGYCVHACKFWSAGWDLWVWRASEDLESTNEMWNPNLSTSSSQRSPWLYSVKVTTASATPNKSYTSFRFGEPTQEKPAPKLSSPTLVTLISPCGLSLTSIMLHLQSRQIRVVQIWLTQHCHHIVLSLSTVPPFSSHHVAGPSSSPLTLLFFIHPPDLLLHCQ